MLDTPDSRLALIAFAQHGIFQRSQAHTEGMSDHMLQLRSRRGTYERLSRDVFRVAGASATWHQRLLTAAWSGGPECCVSHRAAAALHRFDGFRSEIVETIRHQRHDYRQRADVPARINVHVTSVIEPCDMMLHGVIPVTNAVRTLIDLGAVVHIDRLEEALDGAVRDGLVDRLALATRHAWHATTRQRQADNERQNQVVLADWSVLRFTFEDVSSRHDYVVGVVRRALLASPSRHSGAA